MSYSQSITFERVTVRTFKSGKCSVCGRHGKLTKTFCKTVNPFNKDKNGVPKSRLEVHDDVLKEAAAWRKIPLVHRSCE